MVFDVRCKNHRICRREKGKEGIAQIDHYLPGLNGLDILQELDETVRAPVIMLTGSTDIHVAVETMKKGAADYIIKDGNYTLSLLTTVKKVLDKQRLQVIDRLNPRIAKRVLTLARMALCSR